jgi:Integrase core domain
VAGCVTPSGSAGHAGETANCRQINKSVLHIYHDAEWTAAVGTKTAYIERGSPWENGYIESFNARLREQEETSQPCGRYWYET